MDVEAQWYLGAAYIVLVTDNVFHFAGDSGDPPGQSYMVKTDVINELTATGCPVYISLWEDPTDPWLDTSYNELHVNTGEYDPCDFYATYMVNKYPFVELKQRISTD